MKKGYYSMLNGIIRQMKNDGKFIIDRQSLMKFVDFSEEDPEEIERMCKNLMVSVMLYQNNYRSFVKGRGVFIDEDAIKSKVIAKQLMDNTEMDRNTKTAALQKLEKIYRELPEEDFTQLSFLFDDDGDPVIYQEMQKEELIELLERLQAINE